MPTADHRRRRKMVEVRWVPLEEARFPVVAKQVAVAVDLPVVVEVDPAGEDSRIPGRDSDRVDRAGKVIGLVRYCPVAAVDTAAIHPFADCTAEAAAPSPAADDPRTDPAVHPVPAAHLTAAAAPQVVLPEVAAVAARNLDRSYWDSDAAAAEGADGTAAVSSG